MKSPLDKNGVKSVGHYDKSNQCKDARIFSESRAKELLAYEKEIKSMRKVAIEN